MILQLGFAADCIITCIKLVGDGYRRLFGLIFCRSNSCYLCIQGVDIGSKMLDMNVCFFEFTA